MRKYFLTCAVALLAASTANATTDYAEVTAKATIEVANSLYCTDDLKFGTIVVKQNNSASTVTIDDSGQPIIAGDIISVSEPDDGDNAVQCFDHDDNVIEGNLSHPTTIKLSNGTNELDVTLLSNGGNITGILHIPPMVNKGDYTGSFTVSYTY